MKPKKVLLLVDDNEQALGVRKYLLETRGYRVLTATTEAQAMEHFARGDLQLVICDLVMPDCDGAELVRRMKAIRPEMPIMIFSGMVHDFDRAHGADRFLPKGFTTAELLEHVRQAVARKRGPRGPYKKYQPPVPVPPADLIPLGGARA